jgi:thioesterase domain-containing protein
LFCVHPAGGHVFCYTDLASSLGQDQPFYGLQAREPTPDTPPHTKIEALATEYIEAIRAFQPRGPYFLSGWSMGGLIAFEMARQLQQQGQEIALLALIDSEAPSGQPVEYTWIVLLGSFARDIGLSFDKLSVSWEEIGALPPMGQLKLVWSEAKAANLVPTEMTLVDFRKLFDAFKANAQMMRTYAGGSYQGRITLFIASTPLDYIGIKPEDHSEYLETKPHEFDHELDPAKGWEKWATEGVDTYSIPCDHYSIVKEPNVKLLAAHLRVCLQDAAKEV